MKALNFLFASLAAASAPQDLATRVDPLGSERALARQRYERVEAELAGRDLSGLSPEQRDARQHLLEVLRRYVDREDFGVQGEQPFARVPQFVDDDGRRCAMAELLHATGEEALVAAVHAGNNEAWVIDLSENERFQAWLDASGLTMFEAARVQAPAMPKGPPGRPPPSRPGDTSPPSQDSPGGNRPTPRTPSIPATPSGPAQPRTPSNGAAATMALTADPNSWWLWWEYNKLEFLRPNQLETGRRPSADDGARTFTSQIDLARRTMTPTLLRALDDPEARVRVAAARAVGRIGGAPAFAPLLAHVGDASNEVRDAVLLGLGATGSPQAQTLLVELARRGSAAGVKDIGQRGRALAILALGLGRRAGFDASVDDAVAKIVERRTPVERERLGVAAMTYALLAPNDNTTALARTLATDADEPIAVRGRAIEALRGSTDATTLSALQHLASGSRVELRRSAALALGESDHPLVAAALMTAHDLEKEPLAKCFALISLGRHGGPEACDYLLAVHAKGDVSERPWAALALGLAARAEPDTAITLALRKGVAETKRVEDRGAYWLALGLARDVDAMPILRDALENDADASARMYAAQALALLGGENAHAALRKRAEVELSPLARSQVALALGVLGVKGDVDPIARALADVSDPMLQGQFAAAVAFHGSSEALHCLGEALVRDGASTAARAAAIDGLGMLLGSTPALSLGETARSSNFELFDEWLTSALATTL
ncbi:MAG TPA: HEAT repeat domain-containing protein [Planctomycetota bacterium]|nr:HEAT repeat domain-containing protein [Planctomycetota bacterium]